ncbi:MAG: membrane integrity-associated transporter subunit PqiC [Rhodospirillales bacterium]|nr:membrane integrity-associated transporter subunit PqiC [Rhodospirillales bacterium]
MMLSIRQTISALSGLLVILLVSGCGSSPSTSFYTLASSPLEGSAAQVVRPALGVVAVGPVGLPDYVDRPEIVSRSSDYAVSLAPFSQWAGPLDDMVPQVLVEDLTRRLPGTRVVVFPQVSGPNFDYRIAANVTRFDVDTAGLATLSASWQIYQPKDDRALLIESRHFHERLAAAGLRIPWPR